MMQTKMKKSAANKPQYKDPYQAVQSVDMSSFGVQILKRTLKSPTAKLGAGILIVIFLLCLFAPLLAPYDPTYLDIENMFSPPSAEHIFGTDAVGRDVFTRILYGGRYSLAIGFAATGFSVLAAIIIGSIAGYFGGKVENIIMRIMDVWSAFPGTLFAILISSALGGGFFNTILALSVGSVPSGVRMMRGQILAERSKEYLEAAESINSSKLSIMFKHLLPNVCSPMIIQFTMGVGSTITAAAGLSYIGLGIQPPTPEWGAMLADSRSHMVEYPYLLVFPGVAIALVILACNLLGDGLRDALDPKLRK